MRSSSTSIGRCVLLLAFCGLVGCADDPGSSSADADPAADATPPAELQAWMDRLTVQHEYDPETGFIVAKETVQLPPKISEAPPLDQAIAIAASEGRTVIAFATADRCAPCQQYKKDALNDPRVIERLGDGRLIATHVEVERSPELAEQYLGARAIPMTYALRGGERIAELRGQRSAEELLAWLNEVAPPLP
jgi:thiol:disulfide interchange protein